MVFTYSLIAFMCIFSSYRLFGTECYSFTPSSKNYDAMRITALHRYAVKGLSGDSLETVRFSEDSAGTFPDDRRFALLQKDKVDKFDSSEPVWLHKENFLCAFTRPELVATLDTEYRIVERGDDGEEGGLRRLFTAWKRNDPNDAPRRCHKLSPPVFGPVDLATQTGRDETAVFFSSLSGNDVICVTAKDAQNHKLTRRHTHQFGNTMSGVKNNSGDTRTLHIINSNTVRQFSDAIGVKLNPLRFRPNVIVDGLEPWAEFDLVGKTIEVVPPKKTDISSNPSPLRFEVVARTVRCAGVGIDPLQPELGALDVPKLLTEHFPEHGPYLGVYVVVRGGSKDVAGLRMSVGDNIRVVGNDSR